MTKLRESEITYLSLDEATKEPDDGLWDIWARRWWVHYPSKGLAFFRKSPQCNSNESISRKIQESHHPDAELLFVERVAVRHNCGDYI